MPFLLRTNVVSMLYMLRVFGMMVRGLCGFGFLFPLVDTGVLLSDIDVLLSDDFESFPVLTLY